MPLLTLSVSELCTNNSFLFLYSSLIYNFDKDAIIGGRKYPLLKSEQILFNYYLFVGDTQVLNES